LFDLTSSKPKNGQLESWQDKENKELSEQRGSMERHIGALVNRFAIIRIKFRHKEIYIRPIIESIMALQNIVTHEDLVGKKVHKFKHRRQWHDYLMSLEDYLQKEIVSVSNDREQRRREDEQRAYEHTNSISIWVSNWEQNVNMRANQEEENRRQAALQEEESRVLTQNMLGDIEEEAPLLTRLESAAHNQEERDLEIAANILREWDEQDRQIQTNTTTTTTTTNTTNTTNTMVSRPAQSNTISRYLKVRKPSLSPLQVRTVVQRGPSKRRATALPSED